MNFAISVERLGKSYVIQHEFPQQYLALRDVLAENVRSFARRLSPFATDKSFPPLNRELFWALQDVSFNVNKGDRVGIIGRNGAGKSTLLKLLSRITEPTTGRVRTVGRVASLLEVGTGFHPELTGRENIFLNGAILGMSKAEIRKKFDEIVNFAEIERFLDTPVKRYSSGMYVRLAFSVAAHLDADILFVDEVLAVGDSSFQKKCFARMEMAGKEGVTIIFVSHNLGSLRALCTKGIFLKAGQLVLNSDIDSVASAYSEDIDASGAPLPIVLDDIVLRSFMVHQGRHAADHMNGSREFFVKLQFELRRPLADFRIGIYIRGLGGETIMRSFLGDWDAARENMGEGGYEAELCIPAKFLAPGTYVITVHASQYGVRDYLSRFNVHQQIFVGAPLEFNRNHMGEELGCLVLSSNEWTLLRV